MIRAEAGHPMTHGRDTNRKSSGSASPADVKAIVAGTHGDPFSVLGLHEWAGGLVARCFLPGAEDDMAFTLDGAKLGALAPRDPAGYFEGPVSLKDRQLLRYEARDDAAERPLSDPYCFW